MLVVIISCSTLNPCHSYSITNNENYSILSGSTFLENSNGFPLEETLSSESTLVTTSTTVKEWALEDPSEQDGFVYQEDSVWLKYGKMRSLEETQDVPFSDVQFLEFLLQQEVILKAPLFPYFPDANNRKTRFRLLHHQSFKYYYLCAIRVMYSFVWNEVEYSGFFSNYKFCVPSVLYSFLLSLFFGIWICMTMNKGHCRQLLARWFPNCTINIME